MAKSNAAKISRMMLLAPDIIEAILEGRTDDRMMLKPLDRPLPMRWEEQQVVLGVYPVGIGSELSRSTLKNSKGKQP